MDGFTPIRNGLLDHLQDGRMTLLEFAVYVVLHMRADWATGIYRGCAPTLAFQTGNFTTSRQIREVLRRLRNKRYINFRKGTGARGGYDILIHKYEPRVGRLCGTRLNAWKNGSSSQPDYELLTPPTPLTRLAPASDPSQTRPIQEVRSKKEEKTMVTDFENRTKTELQLLAATYLQGSGHVPEDLSRELRAAEAWEQILTQLKPKIDPHTFDTWFTPLRARPSTDRILHIAVPNEDFREMITHRWGALILATSQALALPYTSLSLDPASRLDISAMAAPRRRVSVLRMMLLQTAYHNYARRIFRAKIRSKLQREFRLLWASVNLGRPVSSFLDLSPREVSHLLQVIAVKKPDLARQFELKRRRHSRPRSRVR